MGHSMLCFWEILIQMGQSNWTFITLKSDLARFKDSIGITTKKLHDGFGRIILKVIFNFSQFLVPFHSVLSHQASCVTKWGGYRCNTCLLIEALPNMNILHIVAHTWKLVVYFCPCMYQLCLLYDQVFLPQHFNTPKFNTKDI